MIYQINKLKQEIEPLRQQIIQHKLYSAIKDIEDLKVFMLFHVYAVWDFMSLLKSLQNSLTCTNVPWFPIGSADTRYLINEIVVGEESDVDPNGDRKSHFEVYIDAMKQCGADTFGIERFVEKLKRTGDLDQAFAETKTPGAAASFVRHTFDVIGSGKKHVQAAVFTFGREDLIPGMFVSIVRDIYATIPDSISVFKYYLERHIEVDGDHHSHLALQMTANLCGDNQQYWDEAAQAVVEALKQRIVLWDGVHQQLMDRTSANAEQ